MFYLFTSFARRFADHVDKSVVDKAKADWIIMFILEGILKVFLFPGSLVIKKLGITIEEDGGIMRSLINMIFWGILGVIWVYWELK